MAGRLLAGLFGAVVSVAASSCGHGSPQANDASELEEVGGRRVLLLGETAQPAFFLGPAADAPAVGFGNATAKLIVRGPSEHGRTPIRVHGRLSLEAYVPDELFELRAQRTVAIRGTPVLAAASNRVRLRGPVDEQGTVPVNVSVRVGKLTVGPFQGSVPIEALAANSPSDPGKPLSAGIAYRLAPRTALPLYQAPQGELITLVAPQEEIQTIQVLAVEGSWFSVRLGTGPFIEGYTNAPLQLLGTEFVVAAAQAASEASPNSEVPRRLAESQGVLKRVAANTRLTFRGKPLATFRGVGWARVLGPESQGQVEVLAAADDQVTVRALVASDALSDVDESSLGLAPAATPGSAQELATASP